MPWVARGSFEYMVAPDRLDFDQHMRAARQLGATVASVEDQSENDFLQKLHDEDVWIGAMWVQTGTGARAYGEWIWTDGTYWAHENTVTRQFYPERDGGKLLMMQGDDRLDKRQVTQVVSEHPKYVVEKEPLRGRDEQDTIVRVQWDSLEEARDVPVVVTAVDGTFVTVEGPVRSGALPASLR